MWGGVTIFILDESRKDKAEAYLRTAVWERTSDLLSGLRSDYIMFLVLLWAGL